MSFCLYHFYSFILILGKFGEKEIKSRVQFTLFSHKSSLSPVMIQPTAISLLPLRTHCKAASLGHHGPRAALLPSATCLSHSDACGPDTVLLIRLLPLRRLFISSGAPVRGPPVTVALLYSLTLRLLSPGGLSFSQTFSFCFYATDSQIITSSLDLQTYLFSCFLDRTFRCCPEASNSTEPEFPSLVHAVAWLSRPSSWLPGLV